MSGIVFPDIAGTLAPILQLESADRRNALEESRQKKIDAEEERLNSAKQYVPGALRGDSDAFDKLASIHPDMAIKLRSLADQKDAAKLARAKAGAEWLGSAAGGVLSAPPEEKAAAYQQYLVDGQARGIDMSTMPQQYSPAVDSTLRYHLNSAVGASKVFEHLENQPQAMPPLGGAPGTSAPGGAGPNKQQFISMMTPHAQAVAQATGLDPRLVLAQSALETGYGVGAAGNNYFGIKGGNGPALNTTEAGSGGAQVPTQAAFRTYADPGASAQDYVNLLKSNPRYAPVLQAQGLDAQIDAMGKSGYATDPNYAAKLRQIAQTIPQPTMGAVPPQMAAYGTNAAPMPGPPGGLVPPGPPPSTMPEPRFAQAGGPGVIPQGGDAATGQPGTVPSAPPAGDADMVHVNTVRERARGQGGDVFIDPKTRQAEVQDGQLVIRSITNPRQVLGYAPLPLKPKEPSAAGTDSGDVAILQRAFTDPSAVKTPEWQAAYTRQAQPKQAQGGQLMYPNMGAYDRFLNGAPPPQTNARIEDTPQSRFAMSGKLADDFNQLKPVKAYREVVPIMESMKDALTRPTPVSDLNLVYGLAKIMDPESVVREGEQVMVRNAQSLPDWLRGMISKAQGGSGFVPEQRARIIQEAESRVGALKGQFDAIAGQFGDRAKRYGLNPDDVLTVPSNQPPEGEKTAKAATYLAPGDRPVNRNEIEETARNRNMTPDQVIKLLNLKPSK